MRFQFWSISEDSRGGISLKGSSIRVCLVVATVVMCDANTKLNQSYVVVITLVYMTYLGGDQYLPSIHPWYVLYIPLFLFFLLGCCFLLFFSLVLVTFNKRYFHAFLLNQFLVQVKLSFLSMLFAL